MALNKEDKIWIKNLLDNKVDSAIKKNNKELLQLFFKHFPTKQEVEEIFDRKLIPVREQISSLQDAVFAIDSKFTISLAMTDAKVQRIVEQVGLRTL